MLLSHPQTQINVGLNLFVFLFFNGHLIRDHCSHKRNMLLKTKFFGVIGIQEIASTQIHSRSLSHYINHTLDQSLLFQRIRDMLIRFNISLDELDFKKLEIKFFVEHIFEQGDPINKGIGLFNLSINEIFMFADIIGANLEHLFLKIFHVLHGAFIEDVNAKVILDINLSLFLNDFDVVNSSHKFNALLADMVDITNAFKFNIHGLKFNWLSKGGIKAWNNWTGGVGLIAKLAFVFILLHIIEVGLTLKFILFIDGSKYLFLVITYLSLFENTGLPIAS